MKGISVQKNLPATSLFSSAKHGSRHRVLTIRSSRQIALRLEVMAAALHLRKGLRTGLRRGRNQPDAEPLQKQAAVVLRPFLDQSPVGCVAEDVVDVEEHRLAAGPDRSNG